MQINKTLYGKAIESLAAQWYLSKYGLKISLIATNYRFKGGEIDLIFEEKKPGGDTELVFVEVRARSDASWVSGVESVSYPKQRRLSRTVRHFLTRYSGPATGIRVDILDWDGKRFLQIPNVWLES